MNTKYIKCYPCGLNDNPWLGNKGTCQGWDQNTHNFKDANKDDYIICSDVGEASYNDLHGPEKLSDNYISRGCGTQDIVNTNTSLLQRLITPKKGRKLKNHLKVKDRNKQFYKEEKRKHNKHKRKKNRSRDKRRRHRVGDRIKDHWKSWGKWLFIGLISAVALILIGIHYDWYDKIAKLFKYLNIKNIFRTSGPGQLDQTSGDSALGVGGDDDDEFEVPGLLDDDD